MLHAPRTLGTWDLPASMVDFLIRFRGCVYSRPQCARSERGVRVADPINDWPFGVYMVRGTLSRKFGW
jgi:hypothetical protein